MIAKIYISDQCASTQFDTYDFQKINSHAGVRSDLFHRPLRQTLITDFFGGVSQAEVLPPLLSVPPFNESQFLFDVQNEPVKRDGDAVQNPIIVRIPEQPVAANYSTSDHGTLPDEIWLPTIIQQDTVMRTVRTWASVLLLTGLVGWVGARK